ncbi:MAG: hypothetical protein ABJD24_03585 [Acidimicrobiales bacterium]
MHEKGDAFPAAAAAMSVGSYTLHHPLPSELLGMPAAQVGVGAPPGASARYTTM